MILRKLKFHYEFGDKKTRINHLLFMDDLKLFAESNDQNDSLVNTVYTFSEILEWNLGLRSAEFKYLNEEKFIKLKAQV